MSDNRLLKKILSRKKEEIRGAWEKLHSDLYNLYFSPSDAIK
jgi:hypothetical protein